MTDFVKITDYAAKDSLLTGNPAKLVKGSEIGADFDAVVTAVASKHDATDIGVVVQAYSANLDEYAAVNPTTAGLALLDDATAGDQLTTLGGTTAGKALFTAATVAAAQQAIDVEVGVDVQAYDADIPTVSASQGEMELGTEAALRSMSPLRVAQAISALTPNASLIYGNCRLIKSGDDLKLIPYNGNKLTINGVQYEIPDAGVTLVPTGTTDGVFYIYAYMNTGTMTLEASTTARATSTTAGNKGVEIKSGDDTRTLVGLAYNQTDQWSRVLSWFNRKNITSRAWLTTDRTTTSTSIAEINTEARVYFITWFDEAVNAAANGTASNSAAFQTTDMAIGWNGVAVLGGISRQANTTAASVNSLAATSVAAAGQLAEAALHYVVLGGGVSANTGTYKGGADNATRCELNVMTRG